MLPSVFSLSMQRTVWLALLASGRNEESGISSDIMSFVVDFRSHDKLRNVRMVDTIMKI